MLRPRQLAKLLLFSVSALCLPACSKSAPDPGPAAPTTSTKQDETMSELHLDVQREPLGNDPQGNPIEQFLLVNKNGMSVAVMTYGAVIRAVNVPDRDGKVENVVLGFPSVEEYFRPGPYFGAVCGRYSNRIGEGKFTIDGTEYTLAVNNGPNHLHGGTQGFDKRNWMPEVVRNEDAVGVKLVYVSPDGEEGYPGKLTVSVVYTLNNQNELKMEYSAQTDKPTVLNITNHSYWNLAGVDTETRDVLDHVLQLHADKYLAVDENTLPTGEIVPVKGTALDFTTAKPIGRDIGDVGNGYDHCFVINRSGSGPAPTARVHEPESGRVMEVLTTEPGVQLYTGNYLDGSEASGGFAQHHGFCLECQHFPDSPNQPEFPTTLLQPGEIYQQTTIHRFSVEK